MPPTNGDQISYITFKPEGAPILGYTAFMWMNVDSSKTGCYSEKSTMANINNGNPLASRTNNPSNILILAGERTVLTSVFAPANLMGQYGCRHNVEFVPEKNKSYTLYLHWEGSCKVRLIENSREGGVNVKNAIINKKFC